MDGFLVVDKPAGMTSHDVVAKVRKLCSIRKVGHTGTLDPFATGVLPVALGEGTKAIPFLDESVKEYRAVMKIGETTDTGDCTGDVILRRDWPELQAADLETVFASFVGSGTQIPPMYSALKRNGVPLYRLARRGETVEREARPMTIHALSIDSVDLPYVTFSVRCSRGTYVRTLAADIGEKLGCGGHLVELQRKVSGTFNLSSALTLEHLAQLVEEGRLPEKVVSPYAALAHLKDLQVTQQGAAKVTVGAPPPDSEILTPGMAKPLQGEKVRLSRSERLLAVAEQNGEGDGTLRIIRVFN